MNVDTILLSVGSALLTMRMTMIHMWLYIEGSSHLGPNQGFDPQTGQAFNLLPPPPILGTLNRYVL